MCCVDRRVERVTRQQVAEEWMSLVPAANALSGMIDILSRSRTASSLAVL